jgi:hypothetical protein
VRRRRHGPGDDRRAAELEEDCELGREAAGLAQVVPGHPQHGPARGFEPAVRAAVVFEGVAGAVVLPAVEFDDEAAVGPGEVGLFAFDEDVGLGRRETAVIEEGVEAGLEVSAGVGGWGERAQVGGASLRRVPVWLRAFEVEALGLVDGLLQLVFLKNAGEVEQGCGRGW